MYHEKLEIWRRSCELSVSIFIETRQLNDRVFRNQLTRSGLSIPSNIAEGMEKPTLKDKQKFLYIAKGSLAELKTQVIIGEKIGYITTQTALLFKREAESIDFMLVRLIKALSGK